MKYGLRFVNTGEVSFSKKYGLPCRPLHIISYINYDLDLQICACYRGEGSKTVRTGENRINCLFDWWYSQNSIILVNLFDLELLNYIVYYLSHHRLEKQLYNRHIPYPRIHPPDVRNSRPFFGAKDRTLGSEVSFLVERWAHIGSLVLALTNY